MRSNENSKSLSLLFFRSYKFSAFVVQCVIWPDLLKGRVTKTIFFFWEGCKRPAKEVNFLIKSKQIFDIYNFKKAFKRKAIFSCFAAYGIIFLARKSNNLIFSSTFYVSVFSLKLWNVLFVLRR